MSPYNVRWRLLNLLECNHKLASSIVFRLPDEKPLLVITSGRHRVDTGLVARNLNVEKLHRADADFVRLWSGYAIGGVPPVLSATNRIPA